MPVQHIEDTMITVVWDAWSREETGVTIFLPVTNKVGLHGRDKGPRRRRDPPTPNQAPLHLVTAYVTEQV